MKIKNLAFALMAVVAFTFVACEKDEDDEKKEEQKQEQTLAANQEAYLGTMTVVFQGNPTVTEGVVGVVTYNDDNTINFDFKETKFVSVMPAMDVCVPGIKLAADKTFASDSIVIPQSSFVAAGIQGRFTNDSVSCSLVICSNMLGDSPVTYAAEKLTAEEYSNLKKK